MRSFIAIAAAAALLLQGTMASTHCKSYATTTTYPPEVCDIECPIITKTCLPGQPTGPVHPTATTTVGCTVTVEPAPGCYCPTCASFAAPTA